ncbi:MAG: tRNA 2-thiouridine(34) synthase MnmA [Ruminococcaceae bacterium]|nr:tRNA 2-thiouridine(34) synthase MnmA [Oscillospiraceae bacterium]
MKILVGISGGVDSAYAALKLKSEGHEVEGAVLIMHEYTEIEAAREAATSVGILLHEIDCHSSFECIKENFVSEYISGRTPNPCIICNERVKLKVLYDFAMENGFDAIATGHYANVVENDGRYALAFPKDMKKEQTYMLYRLPQSILSRLYLPLSEETKEEIRKNTDAVGLSVAKRADSQEICFLPDGNHTEYIESKAGKSSEGDFVDQNGKILGKHKGIIHYTVGQRKGLGISLGERVFVTDINPQSNTITLAQSISGSTEIHLTDMVYSGMAKPENDETVELFVKLRYTAPLVKTRAILYPDGTATLTFDKPEKSAPGQSAVLYKDGVVMCGGFINK